jgi:hypothetical protein
VPTAEEDVADTIDGEISDEGDRRYSDNEEEENRSTVVKEKHEGWTPQGWERSMVGAKEEAERRLDAMKSAPDLGGNGRSGSGTGPPAWRRPTDMG